MGALHLRLYITGQTPRSEQAITNIKRICENHISENYKLEIINVLEEPERAEEDMVIATPTLLRLTPPPARRIIGDLSLTDRVLLGLGIFHQDGRVD